jgi:RimJ/RimL family protein N-acetyltransferase
MFVEDDSVGLLTYEYPGVYNGHWFFKVRGRKALDLAKRILDVMYTDYGLQCLVGHTPVNNKAARWAARQIGMKSYGILTFSNGDHELFCMTKDEFYE